MADEMHDEQPRKRIRLVEPELDHAMLINAEIPASETKQIPKEAALDEDDSQREIRAGITAFVSPEIPGFSGVLKQRYTDFLVNEILPSGEVLHLIDIVDAQSYKKEVPELGPIKEAAAPETPKVPESKAGNEEQIAHAEVEPVEISTQDTATLVGIFGEDTTQLIKDLHTAVLKHPYRKRRDFTNVVSHSIDDKMLRTQAHVNIRKIFSSRLESSTEDSNKISISAVPPPTKNGRAQKLDRNAGGGRAKGKPGWDELGGEFLHMTLFKENKDTMEIMYYLASSLKLHVRNLQFAGTKDRRGVTVQRVSACRVRAERIANTAKQIRGAKLGGFKYEKMPLALGQLQGNEFCITLRDCHFPGEEDMDFNAKILAAKMIVGKGVENLQTRGFINYYGLQRFGSFAISTDAVGKMLLQGDLRGATHLILSYDPSALAAAKEENPSLPIPLDDRKRALALHTWETTGSLQKVLNIMPRKFNAETGIIRHLSVERGGKRINEHDWQGALASIPRGLRLMYVHAYQSLVWNTAAAHRWQKYGGQVVEGDLVIANSKDDAIDSHVDDSGELIVRPAEEDRAVDADTFVRARPLSKEEAASGSFDIWDIVLPLPGFDVVYPTNEIGQFYVEFMRSEKGGGLDPHDMRRKWKDISLSGGYRKFLARPAQMHWEVKTYTGDTDQLVETDLDKLLKTRNQELGDVSAREETKWEPGSEKLAVILRLQLGSSQYATMALRELLKAGGVKGFKSDFARER